MANRPDIIIVENIVYHYEGYTGMEHGYICYESGERIYTDDEGNIY